MHEIFTSVDFYFMPTMLHDVAIKRKLILQLRLLWK